MHSKIKVLRIAAALILVAAGSVFAPFLFRLSIEDITAFTRKSPYLSVLVLLGLFCLKAFVWFIPLAALYICAGILFSPVWAVAVTVVCLLAEITIGYFIGRGLAGEDIKKMMEKTRYSKWVLERSGQSDLFSFFLIRLLPGPPVDLTNMFLGALQVPYGKFLLGTLLGFFPGMVPFILMGRAAANPLSAAFLVPFAAAVLVSAGTLLVYEYWHNRHRPKEL